MGEETGPICLVQSPPWSWLPFSLGSYRRDRRKDLARIVGEGRERLSLGPLLVFSSLFHFRVAGKFVLGSRCPFISSWFILRCREPWLMVFIECLCSLFTLPNVTAVHTTQGSHCSGRNHACLETRVTSQPCFFSQVLDTFFLSVLPLVT